MPPAWKMPPLIKVYEALGAIGDNRVTLLDETRATVVSSEGDKTYDVETSSDLRTISSNDNASFWQGYLGYPGIAVILMRGFFHTDKTAAPALAGIPWKELNRRNKNDYAKTIAEIETRLKSTGNDPLIIREKAEAVLSALMQFAPLRGARRKPPVESSKS
jgi:hypothetical protein